MKFFTKYLAAEEPDFPDYINVKRSPRARRVALRLNTQTRQFDLIVPRWMSLIQAQDFAIEQEPWMQARLAELPRSTPFAHGAIIPVLGIDRTIIIERHDKRKTDISLHDDSLHVLTQLDDPSVRIKRWLKDMALQEMAKLAVQKAAQIDKTVHDVTMRDTKSRWGSCSHDGRIMLSWRLILAPYEAMDYVIAHEVAHLKHMDHSRAFWKQCEALCVDYKRGKKWMRSQAQDLMAFGAE